MNLFEDRTSAGKQLSKLLEDQLDVQTVIIPYLDSHDVACEVVSHYNANVELVLSDFITSPESPYADIGAVAEDGTIWINDNLKDELGVSSGHIEVSAGILADDLRSQSEEICREEKIDWENDNILIVSDGISSGFREAAAAGSLKKRGAQNIYLATPHKSKNTMADLESVVEGIFYLNELAFLSTPSACYADKKENKAVRKPEFALE